MMAEPRYIHPTLESVTVEHADYRGRKASVQVAKRILQTRPGGWTTVVFVFDRYDKYQDVWRRRVAIHRYRSHNGGFVRHSSVIVTPGALRSALGALEEVGDVAPRYDD